MTEPLLHATPPGEVVVVTGLSGAGKSTALHALEDLGFFCVDNLPSPVVGATLAACAGGGVTRVALGIDVRVGSFLDEMIPVLDALGQAPRARLLILFLDASDEALLRRFSSTRRPHPLSTVGAAGDAGGASAVLDGVRLERERLASLRARAGLVIDTTALSVHELRRRVVARFTEQGRSPRMRARLLSFGFKYGAPVDADMLFDARFLNNPFFVEGLRDLAGTDPAVREFVLRQPDALAFAERVLALLQLCLPRYVAEGKAYLTIGVGCTGGRHRSVVLAEYLRSALGSLEGMTLEVVHRDIDRVKEDGRVSDVGPPPRGEKP